MDLEWTSSDLAFRDEVRTFFAENLSDDLRAAGSRMTSVYAEHAAQMAWHAIVYQKGWGGHIMRKRASRGVDAFVRNLKVGLIKPVRHRFGIPFEFIFQPINIRILPFESFSLAKLKLQRS